jgi:hypothetical protein
MEQYKVMAIGHVHTIQQNGVDAAQYVDYELEIVPVNVDSPGTVEFLGNLQQCQEWVSSNSESYQYF